MNEHANSPGLRSVAWISLRRRRILPLGGSVIVSVGDAVQPRTVLAESRLPGKLTAVDAASRLGVAPAALPGLMRKSGGDAVAAGELLAVNRSLFGLLRSELRAPVAGRIATVSTVSGQVIIEGEAEPVRVESFLAGKVAEVLPGLGAVVEGGGAWVQGICGYGGEAVGVMRRAAAGPEASLDLGAVTGEDGEDALAGAVLLCGAGAAAADLRAAAEAGAAAVIAGGIDAGAVDEFLDTDGGAAAIGSSTGTMVLVLTEGFGNLPMSERTWDLLLSHIGRTTCVSGRTQIRAGVVRPEVIVPLPEPDGLDAADASADRERGLRPGARVRIVRASDFGAVAIIDEILPEPARLPSGVIAPAARVIIAGRGEAVEALRNLEPI